MPIYQYQALDNKGKRKKGCLESESRAAAFSRLQEQGLTPLSILKASQDAGTGQSRLRAIFFSSPRVKIEEAFYYLGLMLQGGSSLAQGLDILGRMDKAGSSRVWLDIRDSIEAGSSFSSALEKHPRSFPEVYVGMIRVAEQAGKLGMVLEKIAAYEERQREVRGKLITALAYPSTVLLIGAGAVYFLLSRVLPRVEGIFAASDNVLPLNTRVLLKLGQWIESYGLLSIIMLCSVVFCITAAYKKKSVFRYRVDSWLWKVPLVRNSILARFSGLLAFQLKAGITMVSAIEGASRGVGSTFFKQQMDDAAINVAQGRRIDLVMKKQGVFPEMYLTALSAGQRAGQLPDFLERLNRILEREVDNVLQRLVSLVEPVLILCLGLLVGFFVLSVMGPVFDLTSGI